MKYTKNVVSYKDQFLKNLLISRGISDYESFVKPTKDLLLPPEGLDHMAEGAALLNKHLNKDSSIVIVVDCDQDGYTSAAIIWNYIKDIKADTKLSYVIHTGKQHGLEDTHEKVMNTEAELVIIPDAGSNDEEYHKLLVEAGQEVLVLDHHEAETYSQYACVINNQMSANYSNKDLSGAGVVYKFCQYYDKTYNYNFADKYLDLAAIGIIGDMMSITNLETRYIIAKGLSSIKNSCIEHIINKQSFSMGDITRITPTKISFYITPLINALIRVGTEHEKEMLFRSLTSEDVLVQSTKRGSKEGDMERLGEQNARNCVNARSRQNRSKEKAIDYLQMAIERDGLDKNQIICVKADDDIVDSSLTGLVAMQLLSHYKKPVLVVRAAADGCFKGSGRNGNQSELTDLKAFLHNSGYFELAEGHANAFGVSIKENKIDDFITYANKELKDIDFNVDIYQSDFYYTADNSDLLEAVLSLGERPDLWGKDNEEPIFAISDIAIKKSDISIIGKNSDTIKFTINGITYIKFKAADLISKLLEKDSATLEIVGTANLNEWGGVIAPQIAIKDYNIVEDDLFSF